MSSPGRGQCLDTLLEFMLTCQVRRMFIESMSLDGYEYRMVLHSAVA